MARVSGQWHCLTRPQQGDHCNETVFLTCPWWREQCQVGVSEGPVEAPCPVFRWPFSAGPAALPECIPHPRFFESHSRASSFLAALRLAAQELRELFLSARVAGAAADDLTLVFAVPAGSSPETGDNGEPKSVVPVSRHR